MREIKVKDDTKLLLVEGSFLLLSCGKWWEDQICGGGNEAFSFVHVNFDMEVELLNGQLELQVYNGDTAIFSNLSRITQLLMGVG